MKSLSRRVLALSILALVSVASMGSSFDPASTATPMSDGAVAGAIGGAVWADFFAGVSCGLGVGLIVGGYLGGFSAPAAALMTVGVVSQCARALGY